MSAGVASANDLVVEAAGGVGSPHFPFSSKWNGSFVDGGLFLRDYAVRCRYDITEWLSVSSMLGWLENRYTERQNFIVYDGPFPPFDRQYISPIQKITYFVPTIRLTLQTIRADFGAIVYSQRRTGSSYRDFYYPFNSSHRFKPVIGLELGERNGYLFGRFLDTFPLYAAGIAEAGIGWRISGKYEHKISILGLPSGFMGIGYRGEFRVYRETALSLGFSFGATDRETIFHLSLGFKTTLSL
jgi:hypothetical protein